MSPDVPDPAAADQLARERRLREKVRPILGEVPGAEPRDAYRDAHRVCGVLVDHLTRLPLTEIGPLTASLQVSGPRASDVVVHLELPAHG